MGGLRRHRARHGGGPPGNRRVGRPGRGRSRRCPSAHLPRRIRRFTGLAPVSGMARLLLGPRRGDAGLRHPARRRRGVAGDVPRDLGRELPLRAQWPAARLRGEPARDGGGSRTRRGARPPDRLGFGLHRPVVAPLRGRTRERCGGRGNAMVAGRSPCGVLRMVPGLASRRVRCALVARAEDDLLRGDVRPGGRGSGGPERHLHGGRGESGGVGRRVGTHRVRDGTTPRNLQSTTVAGAVRRGRRRAGPCLAHGRPGREREPRPHRWRATHRLRGPAHRSRRVPHPPRRRRRGRPAKRSDRWPALLLRRLRLGRRKHDGVHGRGRRRPTRHLRHLDGGLPTRAPDRPEPAGGRPRARRPARRIVAFAGRGRGNRGACSRYPSGTRRGTASRWSS